MQRFIWLTLLTLTALGCGHSTATTPSVLAPLPDVQLGAAVSSGDRIEAAMGIWTLEFETATLDYALSPKALRGAQQNDDVYWLDVARFFSPTDLRVVALGQTADTIDLTWEARHPFAPPTNLDGPATAANRADLGVAGHLVFLVDVPNAAEYTYFDDVIANPDPIVNADILLRPEGMIPNTLTANTFPVQVLVDERGDGSRVGVSNGGDPTGNYGTDGWTRDEMGPNRDAWTGYGVLHQGQVTRRSVSFDKSILTQQGSVSIDMAILVRYNDPRNATNQEEKIARRLPPAVPDPLQFAYRMPHGALDCSEVQTTISDGPIVANDPSSFVNFVFAVVDWDTRNLATSESDLSVDPDLSRIAVGERGLPMVSLSFPRIAGPDEVTVFNDPGTPTGIPGDEIMMSALLENTFSDGQVPGIVSGLLRLTDPEAALVPPLALPLDSETLLPLAAELPEPVYYGPVRVNIAPEPLTWVHQFGSPGITPVFADVQIDPATGRTYVCGSLNGTVDLDPGPGSGVCDTEGNRDAFLVWYDLDGTFIDAVCWGGPQDVQANHIDFSPTGSLRISGNFGGTADFDPGPATEERTAGSMVNAYLLSLDNAGNFEWVAALEGDSLASATVAPSDGMSRPYFCGVFQGEVDFDPGPGEVLRTANGDFDGYIVGLTATGDYRWVATFGGPGQDAMGFPRFLDNGNLIVPGGFTGTTDFDPRAGTEERTAVGVRDTFLLELDQDSGFQAVDTLGGSGADVVLGWLDRRESDGGLLLGGTYDGTVDFDPGPGTVERTSNGFYDLAVLSLTSARGFEWVSTAGAANFDTMGGMYVTDAGEVRVLGYVLGSGETIDLDPGPETAEFTNIGITDVYFWGLDAAGDYDWGRQVGGLIASLQAFGIAEAPDGSFRAVGNFNNLVDFDPDPVGEKLLLASTVDAWFAKYTSSGEYKE